MKSLFCEALVARSCHCFDQGIILSAITERKLFFTTVRLKLLGYVEAQETSGEWRI